MGKRSPTTSTPRPNWSAWWRCDFRDAPLSRVRPLNGYQDDPKNRFWPNLPDIRETEWFRPRSVPSTKRLIALREPDTHRVFSQSGRAFRGPAPRCPSGDGFDQSVTANTAASRVSSDIETRVRGWPGPITKGTFHHVQANCILCFRRSDRCRRGFVLYLWRWGS